MTLFLISLPESKTLSSNSSSLELAFLPSARNWLAVPLLPGESLIFGWLLNLIALAEEGILFLLYVSESCGQPRVDLVDRAEMDDMEPPERFWKRGLIAAADAQNIPVLSSTDLQIAMSYESP